MRGFGALLAWELRDQLLRTGPWVYGALYAAIGVLILVAVGGAFEGVRVGVGDGNVHVDSPYTTVVLCLVLSLFTSMNVAAISGSAACRDVEEGMHPLVYATPVSKAALLGARYLASLAAVGIVAAGIPLGVLVGSALPVLEPERVGSWSALAGVVAFVAWQAPSLVLTSGLFFGLAALTRRMFPNYVGGVALLVGYLASQALVADLDDRTLAALIDPFGLGAFDHLTRYWTPFERNTLQVWPVGVALANRALWAAVGLLALAGGVAAARLDQHGWSFRVGGRRVIRAEEVADPVRIEVPTVPRAFDARTRAAQLAALSSRAVRDVLGHRYFLAFVAAAVLFELLNSRSIGSMYGTETWPVTWQVIEALEGTLALFVVVVLTFYAGDLVWQQRDLQSAPLYDSLPVPDTLPLLARVLALFAVVVGLQLTVILVGIGVQLADGYTHLQLGVYLHWVLGLSLLDWLPFVALSIAVHAVVNHKVAGHLLLVAFWAFQSFRGALGFEYNLPWFGSDPGRVWSDMNGWGFFLGPWLVYRAYWLSASVVLLVVARLLWVRGTDPGPSIRLREARRRLDGPTRAAGLVALGATGALALFIAVSTSVVGEYRSTTALTRLQVRYEQQYKAEWEGAPNVRIREIDLQVDLYPSAGEVHAAGVMAVENPGPEPIARLLVGTEASAEVAELAIDRGHREEQVDEALGLRVWALDPPLGPGERAMIRWDLTRPDRGFENAGANTVVVPNGTFVHSGWIVPSFGYDRGQELAKRSERRKYDLPERPRMLDLDDPVARGRSYLAGDADRVDLEVRVSTERGQTALAPGALVEQGEEGDRVWFRYRPDRPILHFYSFLSAAWAVRRDRWEGVAIEVWYDPQHPYNVDRMIDSVKASLAHFSTAYGPFSYRDLRIVEFPRYEQYAQSFPSTVPYSEAIGFIARIRDPEQDVDYPYYVTAHEVAHQWWAHQVIGANAQGSTVLSETLSQYSSFRVMEQEYGPEHMHRFLRYEADRYFTGRAFETEKELPLLRVEDQGYVHYAKGGIVLWALGQEFGVERVDRALRTFLERWKEVGPPYPTSRDLLDALLAEIPEGEARLRDVFQSIVAYENRVTAARARPNPDGTWAVTLELALAKTRADELGQPADTPVDEPIPIGIYAGEEARREPLLVEWRRLAGPTATVEAVVPRRPTLAGVDPEGWLLDAHGDDNLTAVTVDD